MGWLDSIRGAFRPGLDPSAVLREAMVVRPPDKAPLGSQGAVYPAVPTFDPGVAMSALGADPWVFAELGRAGLDLARVPLRVSRGGRTREQILPDHPLVTMLYRPSSGWSGYLLRAQWIVDRRATGNAYGLKVYDASGRWSGVLRLPPQSVRPLTGQGVTSPDVYRVTLDGYQRDYAAAAMIHFRGVSWADGASGAALGTGMVEPLARAVSVSTRLAKRLDQAATQGRPSGMAWPKQAGTSQPNPETARAARRLFKEIMENASGGAAFFGVPMEWQGFDWSPEELQATEIMDRMVQAILAVGGVPPVRVGRETANYATADKQAEIYWGDELAAEAELIDAELTYHARVEYGDADLWVYHDFTGVPALQATRNAGLARVTQHILNGMDPQDAYTYEGFEDAPVVSLDLPAPEAPVEDVGEGARTAWAKLRPSVEAADSLATALAVQLDAAIRSDEPTAPQARLLARRAAVASRAQRAETLDAAVDCLRWRIRHARGDAWAVALVRAHVDAQAAASEWWSGTGSK